MENIIQLLKKNRYPFGAWPDPECYGEELGKEMQEKARVIKIVNFLVLDDKCAFVSHGHLRVYNNQTYCLRPDYEDEPEIRQMEIAANNSNCLCMYNDEGQSFGSIANVHERPDFIGFKFEDGHVANGSISYASETNKYDFVHLDQVKNGHFTVLHATHVLFRRNKP